MLYIERIDPNWLPPPLGASKTPPTVTSSSLYILFLIKVDTSRNLDKRNGRKVEQQHEKLNEKKYSRAA